MNHTFALLLAGLLTAGTAFAEVDLSKLPAASPKTDITFEKDILPIFKESSCVRCHGAEKPKAGLRLDSLQTVLKGSKDGKVVVPGNSAKSDLVIAVARLDPETAMPPTGKGRKRPGAPSIAPQGPPPKPLTAEQVGVIRAWIDQGAK